MTFSMFDELRSACEEVASDATARALIVTGAGRGFCSGLDLDVAAAAPEMGTIELLEQQEIWAASVLSLRSLPKPVIAAVNGPAAGAGFSLALAADIRIASPEARFNAAFVRIGLTGGDVGISWLLPRIVGLGHASELLLSGRSVDAEEALRIGMVNRIVPHDSLQTSAFDLAGTITRNSPFAVSLTKHVLQMNVDAPSLDAAVALENRNQVLATRTEDMPAALTAFRNKETPQFHNR
jgi:enoyl-CoA hydratase/carnithine racemase